MPDMDRTRRAERRAGWPIRRLSLRQDPGDDLSSSTTALERLAMVEELTATVWALAGWDLPDYPRSATPGRVLHPRT